MKFIDNTNHFASYNFAKNIYSKYQLLLHNLLPINFVHIQYNNTDNLTILQHNTINKRSVYYKNISSIYQKILKINLHLHYFANNPINLPSEKKLTQLINHYSNLFSHQNSHQTDFSNNYRLSLTSSIGAQKNPMEILKARSNSSSFKPPGQFYITRRKIQPIKTLPYAAEFITKFNAVKYPIKNYKSVFLLHAINILFSHPNQSLSKTTLTELNNFYLKTNNPAAEQAGLFDLREKFNFKVASREEFNPKKVKLSLPAKIIINNLAIGKRNYLMKIFKVKGDRPSFELPAQSYFVRSKSKQIKPPSSATGFITKFKSAEYNIKNSKSVFLLQAINILFGDINHSLSKTNNTELKYFNVKLNKSLINIDVHENRKVVFSYNANISRLISPIKNKINALTKLVDYNYAKKINVVFNKVTNKADKSYANKQIKLPFGSKFILVNFFSDSRIYQDILPTTDTPLQQIRHNNYLNFDKKSNHINIMKRYVESKINQNLNVNNSSKYKQLHETTAHVLNSFSDKIILNTLNSIFKNVRNIKIYGLNKVINNFYKQFNQNTIARQDQVISYINNDSSVKTNRLNDITLLNKVVNNNYIKFDKSARVNQFNDIFYTNNRLILKNNASSETTFSSIAADNSYIRNDKNLVANHNATAYGKEDDNVNSDQVSQPINFDVIADKVYKIFERKITVQKNRRGYR